MDSAPLRRILSLPSRYHFWGSFAIVLFVTAVISGQVADRRSFANGAIYRDVMDRWGAPIVQPAPSLRYVERGTVFNRLQALPLDGQEVKLDARMSYRKRGIVYFSGFEFGFAGDYRVENREGKDIDLVFVFPIDLQSNKVLLSDLAFSVDGKPASIDLGPEHDKLTWTGPLPAGGTARFAIAYRGRGLDAFTYKLDPALPVRGFRLQADISGGENYDYAEGVVAASEVTPRPGGLSLVWKYASLESGVPVGVIVPSERSFDRIIATMARRSWATFLLLFAGLVAISAWSGRRPTWVETYLIASGYAFFFVLLAYLAAYLGFYLAYLLALAVILALLAVYLRHIFGPAGGRVGLGLLVALLAVPTAAVILEGHTGLIYSLEILAGLAGLMVLTTRPAFRTLGAELMAGAVLLAVLATTGSAGAGEATPAPAPASASPLPSADPMSPPRLRPGAAPAGAMATLPLSEVLALYRRADAPAAATAPPRPPVRASLERLELSLRLLDDAASVHAEVAVTVLGDGGWESVPLLKLGPSTSISSLPELDAGAQAVLLRKDGALTLLALDPGSYRFALDWVEPARVEGRLRSAELRLPPATLASLLVQHDESLFRLVRPGGRRTPEGLLVYPGAGGVTLAWERRQAERGPAPGAAEAAPTRVLEPSVPKAFASVVSTLEGRRIWRLAYELSFSGTPALALTMPERMEVSAVYRNGTSVAFKAEGATLAVEAEPVRSGDEGGTLEVVASEAAPDYSLSGALAFELPRLSWPVSEQSLEMYLPQVFNYEWKGGSLSPVEELAAHDFAHKLPAPGKRLTFHQYLIRSSAPSVDVRYTVDLAGSYFK